MSAPEEIVPGVYGVSLGFVNAFVLVDDEVTLIDTGLPRSHEKVSNAISSIGRPVGAVALTHYHFDHRGGLSKLAQTNTTVFAHPLDAGVVRGDAPEPGPNVGLPLKAVIAIVRPLLLGPPPPPFRVDREIVDGDEIPGTGGLRAIHTPGHTPGHLSFLHPAKRLLFVGDAAANRSRLSAPPRPGTRDMDEAKRAIGKIASLDFDTAVFGHGTVLRGAANAEFRKLADTFASA